MKKVSSKNNKFDSMSKTSIFFAILFIILFLAILAVSIAYLADFIRYNGSTEDGLLWTASQREHGLFNFWKK